MNAYQKFILCLQAGAPDYPELDYGVKLASLLGTSLNIVCVKENKPAAGLEQAVQAAEKTFKNSELPFTIEWENDSLIDAMDRALREQPLALVGFSDRYGSTWQRLMRTIRFRHLMSEANGPLLRLRDTCWPIKKILVCSGGLAYTIRLEKMAIELAKLSGAGLTILHVVEPVTLDYSLAREVQNHWTRLIETDTPQAHHLQKVLAAAKADGVDAHVAVRHGQVVEEILTEVKTGQYDLIGLGSVYSSHTLSGLYRPDVTALVAAAVACPILTMRGKQTDTFT